MKTFSPPFRVGFGYDVHKLEEGNDFWLGGIKIDYTKGAVGHSDADVLLHAISDALLGAVSLRDIGFHFPPSDDSFKGIDSKILLRKVVDLVLKEGYKIGNIDATVSLQEPKIISYIPTIKSVIAKVMEVEEKQVSVKATTTEWLGFEGRGEGVSAQCVALVYKQ